MLTQTQIHTRYDRGNFKSLSFTPEVIWQFGYFIVELILRITAKTWQFNKNVICGPNDPNQTRAVIHCIYFKGLALGSVCWLQRSNHTKKKSQKHPTHVTRITTSHVVSCGGCHHLFLKHVMSRRVWLHFAMIHNCHRPPLPLNVWL